MTAWRSTASVSQEPPEITRYATAARAELTEAESLYSQYRVLDGGDAAAPEE